MDCCTCWALCIAGVSLLSALVCGSFPLVVVGKSGDLCCNALEDVILKAVHDAHGLGTDSCVRVDLLQEFVNVDRIALLPLVILFLISLGNVLLRFPCFLCGLS